MKSMDKKNRLLLAAALATMLPGCSTQQMVRVATSNNPEQALKSIVTSRVTSYQYNPALAVRDFKRVKAEFDRLMGNLQKESGKEWGKKESATQPGNPMKSREDVGRYADYLVNNKLQSRQIDVNGASKTVTHVSFTMINTHIEKRALIMV